jgi:hypothetical protein
MPLPSPQDALGVCRQGAADRPSRFANSPSGLPERTLPLQAAVQRVLHVIDLAAPGGALWARCKCAPTEEMIHLLQAAARIERELAAKRKIGAGRVHLPGAGGKIGPGAGVVPEEAQNLLVWTQFWSRTRAENPNPPHSSLTLCMSAELCHAPMFLVFPENGCVHSVYLGLSILDVIGRAVQVASRNDKKPLGAIHLKSTAFPALRRKGAVGKAVYPCTREGFLGVGVEGLYMIEGLWGDHAIGNTRVGIISDNTESAVDDDPKTVVITAVQHGVRRFERHPFARIGIVGLPTGDAMGNLLPAG